MSKTFIIPLLLLSNLAAFAQLDGKIDFSNARTYATVGERRVFAIDQVTPLLGTNYIAQLLYGTTPDSLTPHPGITTFRVSALPGTWTGATRTLNGIPFNTPGVNVQVRVWDYNFGTTFDEARAAGGWWGESAIFLFDVPASTAPVSAFYMENFRGFSLIPEPSAVAFSCLVLLALAFFACARR